MWQIKSGALYMTGRGRVWPLTLKIKFFPISQNTTGESEQQQIKLVWPYMWLTNERQLYFVMSTSGSLVQIWHWAVSQSLFHGRSCLNSDHGLWAKHELEDPRQPKELLCTNAQHTSACLHRSRVPGSHTPVVARGRNPWKAHSWHNRPKVPVTPGSALGEGHHWRPSSPTVEAPHTSPA